MGCYAAGPNPAPPPGDLRWERQLQCKLTAFGDIGKIILEDPEQEQELLTTPQSGCWWQQWGRASFQGELSAWWFPDHCRQPLVQSRVEHLPGSVLSLSDWQPNLIKRLLQGVLSLPSTNTLINETLAAHIISPLPFLEHTVCLGLSYLGQGCAFVKHPGI